MTNLEQIKFAAQIQIGSKIKGSCKMTLVVTKIGEKRIYGYSDEYFSKTGEKREITLEFSTIMNPHYNKDLSIA